MAQVATGSREDALDVLQDTMCKLVEKYSGRSPAEWTPLFYTILQSRIRDWHRRESIRKRFRVWFGSHDGENPETIDDQADVNARLPEDEVQAGQQMQHIESALRKLPLRQQQAFMLRAFESCDVRQTAQIMGCSEGSVKTHYARALVAMRKKLGEIR